MTKFKKYVSILLSVSLIAGIVPMDAQAKTVEDKKAAIQTINEKETMTAQAETGSSETAAPSECNSVSKCQCGAEHDTKCCTDGDTGYPIAGESGCGCRRCIFDDSRQ